MSILDQVIANTISNASTRIISEQHDLRKIDVGGGPSTKLPSDGLRAQIKSLNGPGGWDEAEYGISRAAQIAKLEESLAKAVAFEQTPEGIEAARLEVERTLNEMIDRAIRRAGLDTSNGRVNVMVAGLPAWHKLGVNVAEAVNGPQALELSGTGYTVFKKPVKYIGEDGTERVAKDLFALIRGDTNEYLGSTGKVYKPIQNSEAVEFLDAVLGQFGAKYETAGSIYGGKQAWFQVKLPESRFTVGSKDQVEPYAIFTLAHDGSGACKCFPTTFRSVCANTFRLAKQDGRGKGISIPHHGDITVKIEAAKVALGLAVEGFQEFAEQSNVLAQVKFDQGGERDYFNGILDQVLEVTEAEAIKGVDALAAALKVTEAERELKVKQIERDLKKRENILNDMIERYESERCGINGARGSVWAGFNAATEFADHSRLVRYKGSEETRQSARFESALYGAGDDLKQIAYQEAVKLTTAV